MQGFWAASAWMALYSPTDGSVDKFTYEIGMTVVTRVFLDHVHVDPPQRAPFPVSQPGVVQLVFPRGGSARRTFGQPSAEVVFPIGVVERNPLSIVDRDPPGTMSGRR